MTNIAQEKIKIIVTEDQELSRKSLISLINEDESLDVIAEAQNGKELIDHLQHLSPDIILLDIDMPVMGGAEALSIINKKYPDQKVIMLSMHAGVKFVSEFMSKGARAYLEKNCDAETFFEAIQTVHSEGYYFDRAISVAMLHALKKEKSVNAYLETKQLTEREIDILKEICDGKTNKDISKIFNITIHTVDFHRGNIYKKTGAKNLVELLKYSIKNNIIEI